MFERMLRVCHLITDLNAGGAERMLVNIVTRLDRSRFNNDVVSMIEPGILAQELVKDGIPILNLGMPRGRPSISGLARFVRHIRRTKPHILQTWLYHADLLGIVASWVLPAAKLVWNIRCSDMVSAPGKGVSRWMMRILASMSNRPEAVIVNSRCGRESHAEIGYRPRHWIDIPNGVDTTRFQPDRAARHAIRDWLGIAPQTKVIGLVARFHPMKDHRTFLRAAEQFASQHLDCRFLLCGEGTNRDNPELSRLISDSAVSDCVIPLGVRADMEKIYPAFDVLTLSSAFGEGFPNVLIEAMACGVPCVTTDVGDSRGIVRDSGLVVPPGNPAALAQSWTRVFDADLVGLAQRARTRAIKHYSIDRICTLYAASYEEMAKQSADAHSRL
jgi:glycosyltransferase involved in cell wall biosynthesis